MEKKIIIFCATTALALIAIAGLSMLFDMAFGPKTAAAASYTRTYQPTFHTDFKAQLESTNVYADVQPVPEPATICMLGFGGVAVMSQRKRKLDRNRRVKKITK